jgi:hypothetical protein
MRNSITMNTQITKLGEASKLEAKLAIDNAPTQSDLENPFTMFPECIRHDIFEGKGTYEPAVDWTRRRQGLAIKRSYVPPTTPDSEKLTDPSDVLPSNDLPSEALPVDAVFADATPSV